MHGIIFGSVGAKAEVGVCPNVRLPLAFIGEKPEEYRRLELLAEEREDVLGFDANGDGYIVTDGPGRYVLLLITLDKVREDPSVAKRTRAATGSASHPLQTLGSAAKVTGMAAIDAKLLAELPLTDIARVTFYKRDELTTDLICCDVLVGEQVRTFHEELVGWDALIDHLQRLPNVRGDWFAAVSQPPFSISETVAFSRQ